MKKMNEKRRIERRQRYDAKGNLPWHSLKRDVRNLKEMITTSAELYADRPAVWVKKFRGDEYRPVKYSLLKSDMDALGTRLLDMGFEGKKIAVMGQGCYEWLVTYLAVVNGVGVVVPIDRELDAEAVKNLLDTAGCDAIFYTSSETEKIDSIPNEMLRVKMEFYGDRISAEESFAYKEDDMSVSWKRLVEEGYEIMARGETGYLEREIDNHSMAIIIFTSGTTGKPKGVMLSHWNIVSNLMDLCRIADINEDDITLSVLPIHHTYESTGSMMMFYIGASIAHSEGLKYIAKNMLEIRNTLFIAVPLLIESVYDKIWKTARKTGKEKILKKAIAVCRKSRSIGIDLSGVLLKPVRDQLGGRLRLVVTGASAAAPELIRGFADFGITIIQGYGLTETSPVIAAVPDFVDEAYVARKAGSTGMCVRTGRMKINSPNEDGIGEIYYKGDNVMLGYYNMPEATAETFDNGWFRTGDMGYIDPEGWLYITGRAKNIIVTDTGENIYPEEIEEIINANPLVSDSMVYPLRKKGKETVAVQIYPDYDEFIYKYGSIPDEKEMNSIMKKIISGVNDMLPTYKVIRTVIVRKEDFIRTTTRKIKRKANI